MIRFDKYLKEQLKDPKFKEFYEEERELLEMAYRLNEERKKQGKSQGDIARKANLTQQQFSRVENGDNCNIMTYLKACHAVGLRMELRPIRQTKKPAVKK
jgi:HTH-type transcriptional regulator/antitoxin HipB